MTSRKIGLSKIKIILKSKIYFF